MARALGALLVAIAIVVTGISAATGAGQKLIGKTKSSPRPMCPAKNVPDGQQPTVKDLCEVTGQVTGFQRSADGKKGLFKIEEDGKIVAWSIDLSDPRKSERKTFGEASKTNEFGKAPTAGISIIRAADGRDFKLKEASPVLSVRNFYGEKPVITLDKPLRVREGDVVALTTSTWLPSFTRIGQSNEDSWVASRKQSDWTAGNKCQIPERVPDDERLEYFFDHSSPQRKIDSEREYGCVYTEARILYWAFFVPKN